jgi:hypothetical protein
MFCSAKLRKKEGRTKDLPVFILPLCLNPNQSLGASHLTITQIATKSSHKTWFSFLTETRKPRKEALALPYEASLRLSVISVISV